MPESTVTFTDLGGNTRTAVGTITREGGKLIVTSAGIVERIPEGSVLSVVESDSV